MTVSDAAPILRPIICPACGGENAADAVFCANPACHKALGEFDYVLEQLRAEARWHEALAQRVTAFIGKPQFLGAHLVWFVLWALVNTGVIAFIRRFDNYPFSLLGIILSAEAIFITGFVLITQNHQNRHADKRAELDYEVNVQTYRHINEVAAELKQVLLRLDTLEETLRQTKAPDR